MNKIRLAGIAYESLVNGVGLRRVFFSQGCSHDCKGCFNKDTHDFNGGEEMDMDYLIKGVIDNSMLQGVTFSGGDPFERAEGFLYMAKEFKKNNINIWVYTGYTYEYIINSKTVWKDLLSNIDVLVDGKFEDGNIGEGSLRFKGSLNQRIVDVPSSMRDNKVILLKGVL